jgi:glyoxylase-like metal-dependent hydrolase (beta-lactamase superfamily II)
MQEVAEGIYRLGAKLVNWYIVVDRGKLTIVDAGISNQYNQLPQALASLGKPFDSRRSDCADARPR